MASLPCALFGQRILVLSTSRDGVYIVRLTRSVSAMKHSVVSISVVLYLSGCGARKEVGVVELLPSFPSSGLE